MGGSVAREGSDGRALCTNYLRFAGLPRKQCHDIYPGIAVEDFTSFTRWFNWRWTTICLWLAQFTTIDTPNPNPNLRHSENPRESEVHRVPQAKCDLDRPPNRRRFKQGRVLRTGEAHGTVNSTQHPILVVHTQIK